MERTFIGDIEADGLLSDATQIWCGVFKDINTSETFKFFPGSCDNYIQRMFEFLDTVDVLIMHNGVGYDWPLMEKLYGYRYSGRKVDTLLISRLQNPDRRSPPHCPNKIAPHSVEAWGYRVGRGKPSHEDWSQFSDEMLHRCNEDVEIQHLIYKALLEEGKGYKWDIAHRMTTKLFEQLHRSEEYGWRVDRQHIERAIEVLSRWINRIDRAVSPSLPVRADVLETKKDGEYNYVRKPFLKSGKPSESVLKHFPEDPSLVGGPFSRISFRIVDLNSGLETKNFLLAEGWEPKEWNYNDKNEKTSPKLSHDDPFIGISGKLGKLVARRVQCRHRRSTLTGWLNTIREDGRIASVVSGIAVTGRAKHKNIVNVPGAGAFFGKWMRQCFIAREGWVLVGTDSTANQIRQLAARVGSQEYIDLVCDESRDQHEENAFKATKESGIEIDRRTSKTLFYGTIFGAGDGKAAKIIKGSKEDGSKAKLALIRAIPGLEELLERLTEQWRATAKRVFNPKFNRMEWKNGWIEGLDGRPIFIPSEHQILVYMLQSDEAIQMSYAYLKFHQWMDQRGYVWGKDYGTVNWYHDEWTTECRPEIKEEVGQLASKAIEWAGKYLGIKCPHKGNYKIGKDWFAIH